MGVEADMSCFCASPEYLSLLEASNKSSKTKKKTSSGMLSKVVPGRFSGDLNMEDIVESVAALQKKVADSDAKMDRLLEMEQALMKAQKEQGAALESAFDRFLDKERAETVAM